MTEGPSSARLEASYRNLDRVNMWIANVESKASAALAANAVLLGLTAAKIPAEITPLYHGGSFLQSTTALLFAVYVGCFALSFVRALLVFFPKVEEADESLFFFGSIAGLPRAEFENRMKSLDAAGIEAELIRQTYINARITAQKFSNFRWAMIFLVTSLASGGLFLILKSLQLVARST